MLRAASSFVLVLSLLCARTVAAGDVGVSVGGGSLKIKGTPDADVLQIVAEVGNVIVTPGQGTTVNGSALPAMFPGVTGNLAVALGDGADDIQVEDWEIGGNVSITTGKGRDRVRLNELIVHGKTKVDVGADANRLEVCRTHFEGKIALKSGAPGSAPVVAQCPGGAPLQASSGIGSAILVDDVLVTDALIIKAGGDTGLTVSRSDVGGKTTLKTSGSGNGVALCAVNFEDLGITLASRPNDNATATCDPLVNISSQGDSALSLGNLFVDGTLKIKSGTGDDVVGIRGSDIVGPTKLTTGKGVSIFSVASSALSDVTSKGGKDLDIVSWSAVHATGDVKTTLGAGNNSLVFATTTIDGDLTVKAGNGNDSINTSGAIVGGTEKLDPGKGMNSVN